MYKILLLDDEENILNSLQRLFRPQKQWEIESYSSPAIALNRIECNNYDVIISDLKMPEVDGIEFLTQSMTFQPDASRIMLTGFVDPECLMEAINKAHVFGFITKPWDDKQIISIIERAIQHRKVILENRMLANLVREQQAELDLHRIKV